MKFENTEVWGFKHSLRGMRNPKESHWKSDSDYINWHGSIDEITDFLKNHSQNNNDPHNYSIEYASIGDNDMELAETLVDGGSPHRKFMRQIFVSVDITAPLYWWKEFDTYKVGTVANSTSTMHKLASTPITMDCFETDDIYDIESASHGMPGQIIDYLENLRQTYLDKKDKRIWKELIRWLPESWLQTRTITLSYENVYDIAYWRKNHKLNEWSGIDDPTKSNFISWARTLPYANELLFNYEKKEDN